MNQTEYIFWLTGASGVGKTTLLQSLAEKHERDDSWVFLKFDSIGVPSPEEMVRDFGSGENWQKVKTIEWVDKMVTGYGDKSVIIMDGQSNLEFIKSAFANSIFQNFKIILVDCDQKIMVNRLIDERQQAWLASEDMKNWLKFLRAQATEFGASIINTSTLDKTQALNTLEVIISGTIRANGLNCPVYAVPLRPFLMRGFKAVLV